jgi:hypothetical protein
MIEKLNKYYVLLKYGNFCVEQLNEMSELEMRMIYDEIIKKIKE